MLWFVQLAGLLHRKLPVFAGSLALLVMTLLGQGGRYHWFLDLFSHFATQYFILSILAIGLLLAKGRRGQAVLPASTACLILVFWWVGERRFVRTADTEGSKLSVLAINVLGRNHDSESVRDLIQKQDADLVMMVEINHRWDRETTSLASIYPYRFTHLRSDNFGFKVLSKHKISNKEVLHHSHLKLPSAKFKLEWQGRELLILGAHTMPAMSHSHWLARNQHLESLAEELRQAEVPAILVGDLNITPWSPVFQNIFQGFSFDFTEALQTPTWPDFMPLLWIPIDLLVATPEVSWVSRRIAEPSDIGSDHRPAYHVIKVP
ncbi:endonuclease/exonuclease/phosphatase family protein [Pseudobacteriovorax antillogorgiicola]|uniref:Uncharacterized conserved protein YafD, endonuclease/exonuclease/phosphatase (EEP) superfamily n=1 Tax=Pseudobacteriovorax antillogorgiicola TaxID=1513793 RepID=A0A1Y6BPP5_9BACT|nr:endonuclease/exonuclease/phosphatase family protein [Pseudobacteriovorax antillogorgiicola]TCS53827.1 endonuclease/exonuclease/phosphatase (EEP) superfamily protein YafD [Pseudobacteriovorax antillogorgiicola]SMF21807.1 Uncharacterized conserved protein YafD, endonuclease/exonuclease/phosphatase (EEP) superfamily [Pseudobacteriovorax antillogorgiicola]